MLSAPPKHSAQIDQAFAVQVERDNRRAPGRRLSNNLSGVLAPGKVIAPALPARIKQGSRLIRFRINAGSDPIRALTCQYPSAADRPEQTTP